MATFAVDASVLPPDARSVDMLARLQLAALRRGEHVSVRNPSPELIDLVELMGLRDVLALEPKRPQERGEA